MQIELKKIQVNERLSDDSTCFSADLYIDGVKAAIATDDGNGGEIHVQPFKGKEKLVDEAEAYCKSLPPEKYKMEGREHELAMDLELYISNLLTNHLTAKDHAKFEKKLQREILNGIVWGKADRSQYTGIVYRVTIEEILKRADGVAILRKGVAEARKSMKDGDVILNTNLPTTVLEVIA